MTELNKLATQIERLTIHMLNADKGTSDLARDVSAGLSTAPKHLPPKYFYDELGSSLFEAICRLPEYYVTRAEREILIKYADDILAASGITSVKDVCLIELGSGSATKTRDFIEPLLHRAEHIHYIPLDISISSLQDSAHELLRDYPELYITAYSAEYLPALQALNSKNPPLSNEDEKRIMLFLGSSIGNLDSAEAIALLQEARKNLKPKDAFLLGADLKKSADILVPAYDDALGVTAAFNLNLLLRINRELDADFDISTFSHRALYHEELGRIEMHLVSQAKQDVRIRALDLVIGFDKAETIHTENSYKFDVQQLEELARHAGFSLRRTWYDDSHYFSLNLFIAT